MPRRILVAALAIILTVLHAVPWIPGKHDPILFGFLPITMAMWIVWTLAVMLTLTWIAYFYDPYRPVVEDTEKTIDHLGANDAPGRNEGR